MINRKFEFYNHESKHNTVSYLHKILIFTVISMTLIYIGFVNHLLFYSLSKIYCIVIGFWIASMSVKLYQYDEFKKIIILGFSFSVASVLNLMHLYSFFEMTTLGKPIDSFTLQLDSLIIIIESISFLIFSLFLNRNIKIKISTLHYILIPIILFSILYINKFSIYDIALIQEILSKIVISLILFIAIFLITKSSEYLSRETKRLIIFSIIFKIGSIIHYRFNLPLYHLSNLISHILNLFSIYYISKVLLILTLKIPNKEAITEDTSNNKVYEHTFNNNEILKAILESTADGILVIDNNDKIIHYNNQFIDMWKIPKGVLEAKDNKKLIDFVGGQIVNLDKFRNRLHKALKSKDISVDIIKLKDGKVFERIFKPLIIDGEFKGRVVNFRNITNHEKIIRDLKIKNEIIETSLNAIMYTDLEGNIFYANESFLKLWGYESLNEIINKDSLILWDDKDFILNNRDIINNEGKWFGEVLAKRKDGTIFEVEFYGNVLKDEQGNIILRAGSVIDISNRKKAERELRKNEELYKKLIRLLPEAVYVKKEKEIVIANEQILKILNCNDIKELNEKAYKETVQVHPEYRSVTSSMIRKLKSKETIVDFNEIKLILNKDMMLDVEIGGASFIHQNEMYLIIVIKDITERKLANNLHDRILIKEKLLKTAREYDKLKTQFFSNISHELKTPLNIIFGTVQLMSKVQNIDYTDNRITRYTGIMKQNCYRLLRLINNLIDITRYDSGFIKMHFGNYNIVNIVEDITLSVVQFAKSKRIDIIFDTDIEEKIIACDPEKIERIILNLLSNAIKFTSPNGIIYVDVTENNEKVVIRVKDTGIGIPENKISNVFERFGQVDSSKSRENEGSGIGLSLVKALVEAHNGNIYVRSEIEEGTEFIIELPIETINEIEKINDFEEISKEGIVERINIEFSDIYDINIT